MRGEALRANAKPLNSDTHSSFPTTTPDDESEVAEATKHLIKGIFFEVYA
jgi:hypothetical protein